MGGECCKCGWVMVMYQALLHCHKPSCMLHRDRFILYADLAVTVW